MPDQDEHGVFETCTSFCFDYTPSTFVYVSERGRTGEGRQEREGEGRGERERANEIYF